MIQFCFLFLFRALEFFIFASRRAPPATARLHYNLCKKYSRTYALYPLAVRYVEGGQ